MPTIRIDDEVYAWLQSQACPFDDTPNSVLRRVAKLDNTLNQNLALRKRHSEFNPLIEEKRLNGTSENQFLKFLKSINGQAHRMTVLGELDELSGRFTDFDRANIPSGATVEKSAEWEVRAMRGSRHSENNDARRGMCALAN